MVPHAREFSLLPGDDGNVHGLVRDLEDVSLASLARAVNAYREAADDHSIRLLLYTQEPSQFDPATSPREPFDFQFVGDHLRVRAEYVGPPHSHSAYPVMHQVLTPLLRPARAVVVRTSHFDEFGQVRSYVEFEYLGLRGLRVGDARALARRVTTLASAVAASGELNAQAVEHLVLAGRADLLIGQPEHQTFDAKTTAYDIASEDGAFELAKDVAAFGNADGGLIVCGLRTRRRGGGDLIKEVRPISLERVRPRNWHTTVGRLVVPRPDGLQVRVQPLDPGRGFVLVAVPPQPSHVKPFLVRSGRRSDGGITETYVTVPIRVGEDTEYSDAATLHGLLAAGRVALRSVDGR